MENKEIRGFNFEVRAEETADGTITGRPIVFGQKTDIGWYDEIIERGALDATDLKDVRLLINHNVDMIPLARSRNNTANSTMQLMPDENGLGIKVALDVENNNDARSLYSAVKRGDIDGMSFMFTVEKDSWDDPDSDHPTRHILSIKRVFEVSAVTFPAYSRTSIQARGLSDALERAKESLESERARIHEIERRKKKIKILTEVL